ncbi:4137_t:CDS:1, partial [Acaulospora morrowiae]
RVRDQNAIYYFSKAGPKFGSCAALWIMCNEKRQFYCASSSSYEPIKGEGYFTIADYEVFQVDKKIT